MSTALHIIRTLPPVDQHAREMVLGNIVFAPTPVPATSSRRVARTANPTAAGSSPARLAERVARLEERLRADHEGRIERRVQGLQCLTAAEAEAVLMVCQIVSQSLGVELSKMLGKSRRWPIVRARLAAMWLCRTRLRLGLTTVGTVFGCHHSTIMHACRRVRDLISQPSPDQNALLLADRAVALWCEQRSATP